MLTATNISKSYANRLILDNISLSLDAGESVVIVGRNGAGKSTLLSILAGYIKPNSGTCTSQGAIGFLPQQDNLFEELSVQDNIAFWASASKATLPEHFLDLFEIKEYTKRKIKNLSGGMKKSVAICCALTANPDILIMDEPFAGLDIYYKKELLKAMQQLKNMNKLIIYTSHSLDEITGMDNKVYAIKESRLTSIGTSQTLKDLEWAL